jgi:uncharacterized protein (TIGR03437 family)
LYLQPVLNNPEALNGASVLIGGIPSPLYYVGPGQINAQIPFELDPAKQYQVVVNANGAPTAPQTIQLSQAAPGLAAFPDGSPIAQHWDDYSLASETSPATPGEYLAMYLVGMGQTDHGVASGAAAPLNPLVRVTSAPVVTLGGNPAPVLFAGLTPESVGLHVRSFCRAIRKDGARRLPPSRRRQVDGREGIGSPVWTRFELLLPKPRSARTTRIAFRPMASAQNWYAHPDWAPSGDYSRTMREPASPNRQSTTWDRDGKHCGVRIDPSEAQSFQDAPPTARKGRPQPAPTGYGKLTTLAAPYSRAASRLVSSIRLQ